jgi:ornithine cyclodeaminase/alanine dehydrogenase-like protein (mu-crystallin family)
MDEQASTIILTRRDIARLMRPSDYRGAVAKAFKLAAAGRGVSPPPMQLADAAGGFHVKGAAFGDGELSPDERAVAAFKVNANFPANPGRGLPTIQGAIVLCDGRDGRLLALMDSIEVTLQRTAAATAVAARELARADSQTICICGCGEQGWAQLAALADVLPLKRGFAWDRDPARAAALAEAACRLDLQVEAVAELQPAARHSDVIVCCTTSRQPYLTIADVGPGAFVAAVGADNPHKSEIDPDLMAFATVVVDVLEQCLVMGDLHHAVKAGAMTAEDVHADLGQVLTRARPARRSPDEVILFDSTGSAIQDVAAAAVIHQRALAEGVGLRLDLGQAPSPA